MEPGHEDREYLESVICGGGLEVPQWSPVMKTGNTSVEDVEALRKEWGLNGARS